MVADKKFVHLTLAALLLSFTVVSCRDSSSTGATSPAAATNQQTFQVRGVVRELNLDRKSITIKHEEVTNYMPAMTMPFDVKDAAELNGLAPGDNVTFRMVVTERDGWIDHITKIAAPPAADTNSPPAQANVQPTVQVIRHVDDLKIGDALPEYHFTNELGRVISTRDFKGQALVFTFFFTRCPYPNFCPFLSNSFEETQKKLLANPAGATNWHLLSISFDTEFDSPAALKAYAGAFHYDPAHWSFATGDLGDINAICDSVGAYFGHDSTGGITHNLRTVVIDARGRVQRIFPDNHWTVDDLVAEITKAAAAKP